MYNTGMSFDLNIVVQIIVAVVAILFSITLHEAMHAFTSHWLGDDTAQLAGRLTLNPLKHIDPITTVAIPLLLLLLGLPPLGAAKPVPFNPYRLKYDEFGAALVGVSGPLTNLALALVSGLWLRFVIGFSAGALSQGLLLFMIVNVSFFVFNMIPLPPLDGSRLLYALSPPNLQAALTNLERSGFSFLILFSLIFLVQPFRVLIGNMIVGLSELILGVNLGLF